MPINDVTVAQIGTSRALAYGFVRATGMQLINDTAADGTLLGLWALGDGEWDGFDILWVDGYIAGVNWADGDYTGREWFASTPFPEVHFHQGTDTPVGSSLSPTSTGGDQLVDSIFSLLPGIVTPLTYSGIAYYAITWKPASFLKNPTLSPIGDWRSMRCRIFDSSGNVTGYGFTTNPAWHFVDAWLRIAILPRTSYSIQLISGPDVIPAYVKDRFDWPSIVDAANYCDETLANGKPRFSGSYAFPQQTTLTAVLEQILLSCRGYQQEQAGKISLSCDRPRTSQFALGGEHLFPNTRVVDQKQVHTSANRYIGNFLDLLEPAVASVVDVDSVPNPPQPNYLATINTDGPHPVAKYDFFSVGGNSNSDLNMWYLCIAVPSATQITAYPVWNRAGYGTGGKIGYMQSRFARRSPEILHRASASARGQMEGDTGSRGSKRLSVSFDFGNCTFDQANRLLKYEIYRDLGLDPDDGDWNPPIQISLKVWRDAVDANWNVLKKKKCGDRITLLPSASYEFAGDYEIMSRRDYPAQPDAGSLSAGTGAQGQVQGVGSFLRAADSNAGCMELVLRTYNEDWFFDESDADAASYSTVPGDELWKGPGIVNGSYQVISATVTARDAGSDVTVDVSDVTIRAGGGVDLDYADGGVTGQNYDVDVFVFVDDPYLKGGAIPFDATENAAELTAVLGRMFIDMVHTPSMGGGDSHGGGDGGGGGLPHCFVMGTPMYTDRGYLPNTEVYDAWARGEGIGVRSRGGFERIRKAQWVKVESLYEIAVADTAGVGRCSASTTFKVDDGSWVHADQLRCGMFIECMDGHRELVLCREVNGAAWVLALELEGPSHEYLVLWGVWTHNYFKGL